MNNWELINSIDVPGLKVNSYKAEKATITHWIDFAIVFNSCETRALEYVKLFKQNQIGTALLINFKSTNEIKHRNLEYNRKKLKDLTRGNVIELEVELDIFDYQNNIEIILNSIPNEVVFNKANWFLDITGEPSIYSVALLKSIKQIFPPPVLYYFNVSGIYDSQDNNVHKHFSEGISGDIYIPNFHGRPDYSKPWKYIFLLGFEGERSLSILKKCEPLSYEVIVANPGYLDKYEDQAIKNNECFLRELGFVSPDSDVINIDVGDAVTVFNRIKEIFKEIQGKMNLCIVPLGPKPHSLGAGFFGLVNNEVSIMYQVPHKYFLKESKRGKYIWLYEII